jgi:hypothetical protein
MKKILKKDLPLGVVVYDGPSKLDGKPIICVVNCFNKSDNEKTGDILQSWIIRKDIHPQDAISTGQDKSICGSCFKRYTKSCYVCIHQAPTNVYHAYKRRRYLKFNTDMLKYFVGRKLRVGSYGDPSAIEDTSIWSLLCSVVKGSLGYTFNWKHCDPSLKYYCMASTNTEKEYEEAIDKGWRSFRTRPYLETPLLENEIICPASKEGGEETDCSKCGMCCGSTSNRKSPVIVIHGQKHKIRYFREGLKNRENKKKYIKIGV